LGFDNHNPVRREASPANSLTFYNYCDSGLVQSGIARSGGRVPITSRSTAAHCAPIDGRPLPFKITLHWANPADTG
jgi:hypothetical protein